MASRPLQVGSVLEAGFVFFRQGISGFEKNACDSMTEDFPDDELDTEAPGAEPEADSVSEFNLAAIRRQAVAGILEIVTAGATARQAGQRAFVLAHVLKLSICRTQTELADQLDLTPPRITQLKRELLAGFNGTKHDPPA